MKTYSIDDGDGTNNASGIQSLERATAIAQRVANDTGMVAIIYSDDGEEWTVDPI